MFVDVDPITFEEASKDQRWIEAMDQEIESIERNDTCKMIELPKGKKTIGVKWVYKTKLNARGAVEKSKAYLVENGYKQKHGVDYDEIFVPITCLDTICLILDLSAQNQWKVLQMDVKSAFLNGSLEEEVYVDQPQLCEET